MNFLKRASKKRGYSLHQLSRVTGLSVSILYAIDHDPEINVTIRTIMRLYVVAGLKPEEYLTSCERLVTRLK